MHDNIIKTQFFHNMKFDLNAIEGHIKSQLCLKSTFFKHVSCLKSDLFKTFSGW